MNMKRINENLTTLIPTFIKIEDSYFYEKELHLNFILRKLGFLIIFKLKDILLTMIPI